MPVPTVTPTTRPPRSRWPWIVLAVLALVAVWQWDREGSSAAGDERRLAGQGRRAGDSDGDRSWQRAMVRARAGKRLPGPARVPGLIRVSGRVIDASTDAPVGDVEVVFADGASEASAVSDLGGRYTIDVPAGRYRPFVRAQGMLSVGRPERERLPTRPRAEQVAASTLTLAPELAVFHDLTGADLEVVRSGVIRGRVFSRDGRPIAGAVVRARAMDGEGTQPVLGTDVAETDLDGTFTLEVAARPHQLEAFHDDFGAVEDRPVIDVDPGAVREVDLTMYAGCIIAGVVVKDGQPAGDGSIERAYSAWDDGAFSPSGAFEPDGSFRWTTDETATVTLRAWPWKSPPSRPQTFECRDGARYEGVVFDIPRMGSDVSGTVLTAAGAPAAHAFVDVTGLTAGTMNQQERADEQGQWEVFALPAGEYVVSARVPGHGVTTARISVPSRGHVLQLSGTGSMTGSVKGITDGAFAVEVDCSMDAPSYGESGERFLASVRGGTYRIDGLPACHAMMRVRNGAHRSRRLDVPIPAGGVVTVDLDLAPPVAKEVRGLVKGEDGQPVAGAMVASLDNPGARVATGSDGRFTLRAEPGSVIVIAGADGAAELMVPDDDQPTWDVEVDLGPIHYD